MSKELKFIIFVPDYNIKSNGVLILYKLSDYLHQLGYLVYLYIWNADYEFSDLPDKYLKRVIKNIEETDESIISIIPDAAPNYLSRKINSKYRVWYYLNKPMILTGESLAYKINDIFISYSNLITNKYYQLFFNNVVPGIESFMNKNISRTNKKKNQIVIYWGKCRKSFYFRILFFSILSGIKIVSVNREWPPNKRDLYKLISDSRLLVSFDPLSNLCYESTLCRTPVFIIDNYINVNFTEYNIPLYFITTSLKKAIVYYKKGINIKEYQSIISIYNISTQNHLDIVKKFVVHLKAEIDALANQSIDEKKLIIDNISESDLISYKQLKNNGRFTKAKLSYQLPLFNSILALKLFNLNILSLLIEFSFFILRTDYILTNKIRTSISKHKSDLIENYLISTL